MNRSCEQFRTALLSAFDHAEIESLVSKHRCGDPECSNAVSLAREVGPRLEKWAEFESDAIATPSLTAGVLAGLAASTSSAASTAIGSLRASSQRRPFEWATAAACGLACCLTVAFGVVRGDTTRLAQTSASLIGVSNDELSEVDPQAIAFVERTEKWLDDQTSQSSAVEFGIEASLERSANWLTTNFGSLARSLQQVGEQAQNDGSPPTS